MTEPASDAQLLGRLRQRTAELCVFFGDFVLASGRRSDVYFDLRRIALDPEGHALAGACLLRTVRELGVDVEAVGGLAVGAVPVACAVAGASWHERETLGPPLSAFFVRKEAKGHGRGRRLEGRVEAGSPVVVVDDVWTTGGSTLDAVRACEEAGLRVEACLALCDRGEGGLETLADYRPRALFSASELLELKRSLGSD